MPLQLSDGDAATLAALPEFARRAITADLEKQQDALCQRREREQADADAAEASRLAHPVNQAILAENARRAAQPPRPRPAPAPAGMTVLDARSYARSPAMQQITARNVADVAAAHAKQAAEAVARVERLEQQAVAIAAAAQVEEQRARSVAHAHQIERALIALAERFIKQHPDI